MPKNRKKVLPEDKEKTKELDLVRRTNSILQALKDLTVPDILIVLGNAEYALGTSLGGLPLSPNPSPQKVRDIYLQSPSLPAALQLQGYQTISWAEDWGKVKRPPNTTT